MTTIKNATENDVRALIAALNVRDEFEGESARLKARQELFDSKSLAKFNEFMGSIVPNTPVYAKMYEKQMKILNAAYITHQGQYVENMATAEAKYQETVNALPKSVQAAFADFVAARVSLQVELDAIIENADAVRDDAEQVAA